MGSSVIGCMPLKTIEMLVPLLFFSCKLQECKNFPLPHISIRMYYLVTGTKATKPSDQGLKLMDQNEPSVFISLKYFDIVTGSLLT